MTLRLRHLFIDVTTSEGPYGVKLAFTDGLNVIRADNSMGKSTVMQAIVYSLGLEGMFGPSQEVPLAHAVTDYLEHAEGIADVLESNVYLEFENAGGEQFTVQRAIKGTRDRHLITLVEGRATTRDSAIGPSADYFVRERFATTSERGFHKKLTEILGWELPKVPRFNDVDCPLYLEAIFPLFYVEQKLGWGKLPARFPTYLGIRDTARRTVEFVLGLDAYKIAIERAAVQDETARLRARWASLRNQTTRIARPGSGIINGIPLEPVAAWPPEIPPRIMVSRSGAWIPLQMQLVELRERLSRLQAQAIPSAGAVDTETNEELNQLESQLGEREATMTALVGQVESDRSESMALEARIKAVEDDLRKHKDLGRLQRLGSADGGDFPSHVCPTCHQDLPESLLDIGRKAVPMSVEQNIEFLEEQLELFQAVLTNARSSIEAAEVEIHAHRAEAERLRQRIRSLRETITSPTSMPSIDAISERIRLEQRIANLESVYENFEDALAEFAQLADEWKQLEERKARLPKGSLSESDQSKVLALETSFRGQLDLYHMESLDPKTVNLSRGNYEPEVAGLNLSADVSASDLIRMQWAYILSLAETGRYFSTNHPGIVMMDEPQQQSVQENDFRAMLQYAKALQNVQVIIATSDESPSLPNFLATLGVGRVHHIKGRVLQKL
jgi:predicted  nucleic acid-binding Zn-ribbon protein